MNMSKKDVEQALAKELSELSEKQSETRQTATYIPVPQEEWEAYDKRCERISDLCTLLEKYNPLRMRTGGAMNEKSTAALSGRVDKIIVSPLPNVPDKAQISLAGGEPLYREMRIPDALTDKDGHDMILKPGQSVEVTIEADTTDTTLKEWQGIYQTAVDRKVTG